MRLLLIGGNGFIGRFVAAELTRQGHELAIFHRGTSPEPTGIEEIRGDRNELNASADELKRFAPEVVIDFVISSGRQAEQLTKMFRETAQRLIILSSIDVYRAIGISHGTESGPLQEVPLIEDSELRRNLQPYSPESMKMMRTIFSWATDDYDKIPAERIVMAERDPDHGVRTRRSAASLLCSCEEDRGRKTLHYFARNFCGNRSACRRTHLQRLRRALVQRARVGAKDRHGYALEGRVCRVA